MTPQAAQCSGCKFIVQGPDPLQVTVYNNIPADWPLVSEGISVHWHGLSMKGAPWYDGVGYLAQCPIKSGTNFTYRFQVSHPRMRSS